MKIEVSDEIGLHLAKLAEERELTVEELISAMLERNDVERKRIAMADLAKMAKSMDLSSDEANGACPPYLAKLAIERGISPETLSNLLTKEYPPGSMGRLAQVAVMAGMASKHKVDTSVRSREILNSEFANFVDRRIRE